MSLEFIEYSDVGYLLSVEIVLSRYNDNPDAITQVVQYESLENRRLS